MKTHMGRSLNGFRCNNAALNTHNTNSPLMGKSLLVIGGVPRSHSLKRTESELELRNASWIGTRERNTRSGLITHAIRREEPDVVVALYGLMRHSHSEYIRKECKVGGIPLIVLHRSFSANQVIQQWQKLFEKMERRYS